MVEYSEQIERIRAKLDAVRERGLNCFGAGSHRFELGPPLDESEVRAFEVERGVTLPPAYRAFLVRLGHGGPGTYGGAGPYYGIYDLEDWPSIAEWIADDVPHDWLAQPSPLHPGTNALPPDTDDDEWPDPATVAMYAGIQAIGSRGCSYSIGLIVSGESRGRVVYVDADHIEQPYVVRDADFLDWYERWLDELLAGYSGSWFGYGPAGGESRLLEIIRETEDDELRVEAIRNLHKLPAISELAWPTLARRLGSSVAAERTAVTDIFSRAPDEYAAVIGPLLEDPVPGVRASACRTLGALGGEAAEGSLWTQLCSDVADQVRMEAFFALKKRGWLESARLETIVADPRMGNARSSAAFELPWNAGHESLLLQLLADEDPQLRRHAAATCGTLGLRRAMEAALRRFAIEKDSLTRTALVGYFVAIGDENAVGALMQLAGSDDDFERLEGVDALARIGADEVEAIAHEMLRQERVPRSGVRTGAITIAEMVRKSLEVSPNAKLRALARGLC